MKIPVSINNILQGVTGLWKKKMPSWHRLICGKTTVPPNGYTAPMWYQVSYGSNVWMWCKDNDLAVSLRHEAAGAGTSGVFAATFKMVEMRFPTFFVTDDFAESVWNTTPPEDMSLEDVHWPLDAMLFVMSDRFMARHFPDNVAPFLGITKLVKDTTYPTDLDLPTNEVTVRASTQTCQGHDRVVFSYITTYFDKSMGHTLQTENDGTYRTKATVEEIESYDVEMRETTFRHDEKTPSELMGDESLNTETETMKMWRTFMVRLLLAINAEPKQIIHGERTRRVKIKNDRVRKSELWSPNWVGRDYRLVYEGHGDPNGTHVRMHWRKGHFRKQHYGRKRAQTKVIWIHPVLVNKDRKEA